MDKIAIASLIFIMALALVAFVYFRTNGVDSNAGIECYDCGCDTWMKQDFHCDMAAFNKSEAARCFNEYLHGNDTSYQYGVKDIVVTYMEASTGKLSGEPEEGYVDASI